MSTQTARAKPSYIMEARSAPRAEANSDVAFASGRVNDDPWPGPVENFRSTRDTATS